MITIENLIERAAERFYYLASPYTSPTPELCEERVMAAHDIYSFLIAKEVTVYHATYGPHRTIKLYDLPTTFEFWHKFNDAFLKVSAGVLVAAIDGWSESKGIKHEVAEARRYDLPVFIVTPTRDLLDRMSLSIFGA